MSRLLAENVVPWHQISPSPSAQLIFRASGKHFQLVTITSYNLNIGDYDVAIMTKTLLFIVHSVWLENAKKVCGEIATAFFTEQSTPDLHISWGFL